MNKNIGKQTDSIKGWADLGIKKESLKSLFWAMELIIQEAQREAVEEFAKRVLARKPTGGGAERVYIEKELSKLKESEK